MATTRIPNVELSGFKKLMLFLLGAIVLSPLSSNITINFLHFPVSAPEILFIPFLPFLKKHYRFASFYRAATVNLLILWIFLIILAILWQYYSLYAILSTARCYLYLILTFLLFSKPNTFGVYDAFYLCCGSIIGWLIAAVFSYQIFVLLSGSSVSYGPMLTFPIVLGFCGIRKRYKTLWIYVGIILAIGMFGGVRRAIFVLAITLLLLLVYYGIKQRKAFFRYMLVLGLGITILVVNYESIGQRLSETSSFIYERIFRKTVNFVSGETNEGDEKRKEMIGWIVERIPDSILPKGFVSKQTATDENTGVFYDVPMLELEHTLGFWGTLIIIFYFGQATLVVYRRIKPRQGNDLNFIFIGGAFICMVLLFLEGSFISFPYAVPFTGYILGNIQRFSKTKSVTKIPM